MSTATAERKPVFAPASEQPAIRELARLLGQTDAPGPVLGRGDKRAPVPGTVAQLLARVVQELERGNAVTIVPVHAELTTFQAAELLNVSRPYLIRLLDRGDIPYRKVGTHRRILAADLLNFKEGYRAKQRAAVAEMAREAQAMGLYE